MSITVIAGLGNPGASYDGTRHNIGFALIDALAQRHRCSWSSSKRYRSQWARLQLGDSTVHLIKPDTYMNESGKALSPFCSFHRIEPSQVLVLYDDITLDVARSKLSTSGGDGGHNGIRSLFEHLGKDFVRYRIGVGAKTYSQMDLKDHVLSRFTSEQQQLITSRLPDFVSDLELIIHSGVEHAMNQINPRNRYHESNSHT